MSNKEHVALVKRACRVCNNTEDAEILLATQYKTNIEGQTEPVHDLKPYHRQVVGFLKDGMCKGCKEAYKGYYVCVGIIPSKSENMNNPFKTGEIMQVKKESEFGLYLLQQNFIKHDMCYVDQAVIDKYKNNDGDK